MDDQTFWSLVDCIDRDLLTEDDEAAIEPLIHALARLSVDQIEGFEEALSQKLYALDGRAYAEQATQESNDGFLYARCFVIASGRAVFERVLADPGEMSVSIDEWCEPLLTAAENAYVTATGNEWEFQASVSYETGSNKEKWP